MKVQTRKTLEQKMILIKNEQFHTIKKKHDFIGYLSNDDVSNTFRNGDLVLKTSYFISAE